ncbi:MAG: hypothetical protein AAFR88_13055, partial [Pseudomonadota bacterium]
MLSVTTSYRAASFVMASALAISISAPAAAQDDTLPPLPELPPVGGSAPAVPAPALESPMPASEVQTLPPEYRSLPVGGETTTTTIGADGVETITRTRRIASSAPAVGSQVDTATLQQGYAQTAYVQQGYIPVAYAPAPAAVPVVFNREQWLDECRRRTDGRSEKEKGGIIGGLLGAIGGGILGNVVADGERLGGTLIGAGVGGLAGILLGNLIGGGKKNDRYDCEAALDGYLQQYADGSAPRIAARTIPAYPAYGYQAYAPPAYGYGYGYAPPVPTYGYVQQQTVLVPV